MLKKIISSATGFLILFLSILTPFSVNAVDFEIPVDYIIDENQLYQATDILSPDEIPINDSIKNLDENIIKIMIDPSHYSYYNQSPVYSPYWESVMTWTLSNYLQE